MRKDFLKKLAIVSGSILFFLVGAELAMRCFFSGSARSHKRSPQGIFCKQDKLLGWIGIPGITGTMTPRGETTDTTSMEVVMNGDGFLDDRHSTAKTPGSKRLLFLGDSFTAGLGISRQSRFTDVIKEQLPANHEVINMGMWGYGTDQQLLTFEEKGLKYAPDIVVLVLFLDDLFTNHLFSVNDGMYPKPKFSLTRQENLELSRVPVIDNRGRSMFWNTVVTRSYELLNRLEIGKEFDERGWLSIFDRAYLEKDRYDLALRLIGEIAFMAKANNARFLLVVIPWKEQIHEKRIREKGLPCGGIPLDRLDLGLPQRVVARFCNQLELPVLDLLPAFKTHSASDKLFFDVDCHWTEAGHRLAATQILTHLRRLHYL